MNKLTPFLLLLCGFLLGVVAGPWLWPRGMMQQPAPPPPEPAPAQVEAQPMPPPVAPEPPPPPDESALVLKGVFVAADPSFARALVAYGDEQPQLYKVDDKLPDGSVLKSFGNKHIEVERNGDSQTLVLERGKSGAGADEPVAEPAPDREADTSPAPSPAAPAGEPGPSQG